MNLDDYHRERTEAVFSRNRRELGLETDRWADRLKSRFKDGLVWLRRIWTGTVWIWIVLGMLVGSYIGLATASPVGVTVRHLLTARNCDMARAVDLAPAYRGAPGYWARNDADDDGIACEPWPR